MSDAFQLLQQARGLLIESTALPHEVLARWHGLPSDKDSLSAAILEVSRHARALSTALTICKSLDAAGVPHAVIKGPLLQELLYGDAAVRPYADLDLVVLQEFWTTARAKLRADDWRSCTPRWIRSFHFHEVFEHRNGDSLPVELHRALVDRANLYRINMSEIFGRLIPYAVPGGTLPGLCLEDLWVYLCLHAAKHGFLNEVAMAQHFDRSWFLHPDSGNRLIWFVDIALLMDLMGDKADWTALSQRLRFWNITRTVATTLQVLNLVLPATKAAHALERLGLSRWQAPPSGAHMRSLAAQAGQRGGLQTHRRATIRPARLKQIPDLLFPATEDLRGYYGENCWTSWRRISHPFTMTWRLLVGCSIDEINAINLRCDQKSGANRHAVRTRDDIWTSRRPD